MATNVVVSRPPERRLTGKPTARATSYSTVSWTNTLALNMLWSLEAATENLDFLSVRIFCSIFA